MTHPYRYKPDHAFWSRGVSAIPPDDFDPVTAVPFLIGRDENVAAAGSCFAQHISRFLQAEGFGALVTEPAPLSAGALDTGYGVFPARFGNVYTIRQMLQLLDRAYSVYRPLDSAWAFEGGFVDPFRPRVQTFQTVAALENDRAAHFGAVRRMFEDCDVFVFTLGLTEAWQRTADEAVFPLAPGVHGSPPDMADYGFVNFSVARMQRDLLDFIDRLRMVNPAVRLILTVSPVSLAATYEDRHVVVSTVASKAALRVVADEVSRLRPYIAYFPSFEIITGPQARGQFLAGDLREVNEEGVSAVMRVFRRHFLMGNTSSAGRSRDGRSTEEPRPISQSDLQRFRTLEAVVCDEEALVP